MRRLKQVSGIRLRSGEVDACSNCLPFAAQRTTQQAETDQHHQPRAGFRHSRGGGKRHVAAEAAVSRAGSSLEPDAVGAGADRHVIHLTKFVLVGAERSRRDGGRASAGKRSQKRHVREVGVVGSADHIGGCGGSNAQKAAQSSHEFQNLIERVGKTAVAETDLERTIGGLVDRCRHGRSTTYRHCRVCGWREGQQGGSCDQERELFHMRDLLQEWQKIPNRSWLNRIPVLGLYDNLYLTIIC